MDDADTGPRTMDGLIAEFSASGGAERSNAQLFVVGFCEVLGLPRPKAAKPDTAEDDYVFERKIAFRHPNGSTSPGWIDCYKRDCRNLKAQRSTKLRPRKAPDDPSWALCLCHTSVRQLLDV